MIEWFMKLSIANQIAIIVAGITAGSGIIAAIIKGIFSTISSKKQDKGAKYKINQNAYDGATQIGIQINNTKEGEKNIK